MCLEVAKALALAPELVCGLPFFFPCRENSGNTGLGGLSSSLNN
jgi:hypothetical protein